LPVADNKSYQNKKKRIVKTRKETRRTRECNFFGEV
jgi:hypothetical protein